MKKAAQGPDKALCTKFSRIEVDNSVCKLVLNSPKKRNGGNSDWKALAKLGKRGYLLWDSQMKVNFGVF